jgi:hypothetical protein
MSDQPPIFVQPKSKRRASKRPSAGQVWRRAVATVFLLAFLLSGAIAVAVAVVGTNGGCS